MRKFRYIAVFSFALLLFSFNRSGVSQANDFQKRVNQFIYDGLDFKLGKTRAEIISNLGNPENMEMKKVKNIHYPDEIIDEIYELFYDGLYIRIYKATAGDREFIEYLSITSDRFKIKWGLNIGSSKEEVKNILGNPIKEDSDVFTYEYTDGYPDHVYFYFRDNAVYRIDWEFWID